MRTFISINIDDPAKEKILEIQNNVKDEIKSIDEKFLKAINWTGKDKFHLTMFFIGEVNVSKLKEIDDSLTNMQAGLFLNEIRFDFKCINAFPKLRYPRVLIIELSNKDGKISELSRRLNESLKQIGIVNEKIFHPHITLGRIKRDNKINLSGLGNKFTSDLSFSVKEFYLMESKLKSTGAEYPAIKKYDL